MRWAEVEGVRHGESLSQAAPALWSRAALELQRGREAVARIPHRGRGGRGSTSRGVALEAGDPAESLHPWLAEETGRKGPKGGNQQLGLDPGHQLVDQRRELPPRIPPRGIEGHERVLAEEPLEQSITGMLIALSLEVKGGFETSNANQKEIRGLCETLGEKIDELAGRTAALEEEVGDLRTAVERNKVEIQSLRTGEESVLLKLESLENNQRRNNLRFLKVPEGMEGRDLKGFIVRLIKQEVQVEDTEEAIARDIQRVHRDPFRKLPNKIKGKENPDLFSDLCD
ncbi:hypothetical protein NDU88_004554 [Pleurodeles waltl]|uniref:Uncharacterized protein n=1 Tax=Pleurodeles waltl TaxID=8319 RepID=A0AAV7RKT4_PLEWA|nr:hypothetical protein NDU88_004554 [Pleurodeles waltl]